MLLQLFEMESPSANYADLSTTNQQSMHDRPWVIALFGGVSVFVCCIISQVIASSAKKSKLRLNKFYMRKQQEKDELIQFISQEQQMIHKNPHYSAGLFTIREDRPSFLQSSGRRNPYAAQETDGPSRASAIKTTNRFTAPLNSADLHRDLEVKENKINTSSSMITYGQRQKQSEGSLNANQANLDNSWDSDMQNQEKRSKKSQKSGGSSGDRNSVYNKYSLRKSGRSQEQEAGP